jgi:ABC transporter substrate binding protein (PQQ-dependent alcohol dehydrogenase system)
MRWFKTVAAALVLWIPAAAWAAGNGNLNLVLLEWDDDPRYRERAVEARFPAQPWGRPYAGAAVAVKEARFAMSAAGTKLELERRAVTSADQAGQLFRERYGQGVRIFLLDLPAVMVAGIAALSDQQPALLFNVSALDDALRQEQCHKNLFHTAPSRSMLTDALAQYLVFKKWRDLLVLKGSQQGDAEYYRAFQRSAKRYGLKVEAEKDFVLGRDPRQRSQNNVALLTAGEDYEVVYVVDSQGEFARDVPYQVQKPRPVVGAAGLVADWWHWAWERHGAPQVNKRFLKRENRPMTGYDWSAWMAVKVITEAVLRTRSSELSELRDYIRGGEITLDGVKGYPLNFRSWNNQLRQPVFLTTGNWVVAQAPLEGFLHQSNNLDTLGFDQRENRCKL